MAKKIEGTIEAWESDQLGADEEFVVPVSLEEDTSIQAAIDDALELQPISIRLQKALIEDLKMLADMHGIGYQPLIKQILKRFVDGEMKVLARKFASERVKERKLVEEAEVESEAEKMVVNGN